MTGSSRGGPIRWLRFGAGDLALFSAASLLFLFCESKRLAMNDLGIYLSAGREMVEKGGLADVDRFTHTVAGAHFLNGTWGAQWLFFRLFEWTGFAGLQMLLALAVCGSILLAGAGARAATGSRDATGPAGLLCAWLIVQNIGLRPQLFSLPLFAAYAALALGGPATLATGALSLAVVVVWANLHGSFVLAPILSVLVASGIVFESLPPGIGLRAAPRHLLGALRPRQPAFGHLVTAACVLAGACLNPYGPAIYRYVAENSTSPSSRGLSEWAATTLSSPAGIRLASAFMAVGLVWWIRGRVPRRRDLPALLAFTLLALTGIRHVVWLGFVLPIVAARPFTRISSTGSDATESKSLHPAFVLGVLAFWTATLVAQSPFVRISSAVAGDDEIEARFAPETPIALAAWAAEHGVEGRLFNPMEWGSYLSWRLPPGAKLFVDVRIWIFPRKVWEDFVSISSASWGWDVLLDEYRVDYVILDRRFHRGLIPYIERSPAWEKVYGDEQGLIFKRRAALTAPSPTPGPAP